MKQKTITFTSVGKAELLESELTSVPDHQVLVENEVSGISAGTERACLLDMPNLADEPAGSFPKRLGYSGVGRVVEVGAHVHQVKVGDRVLSYKGSTHANYNYLDGNEVLKLEDDSLPSEHAVFGVIGSFSLNGLRKTRLEIGESAVVVGLGILGLLAVSLCRIAGASPVIATDLSPKRRKTALAMEAHQAFDPTASDYIEQVKAATGGGAQAVIEVTGQSIALKQALSFVEPLGRIALLGCTRVSDTAIDFYQQVHRPGVEIIGAHGRARPQLESRPHAWTWQDDIRALWRLMADGRLDMDKVLTEVYSPDEAPAVYKQLAEQPQDFPVGAVFDWRRLK
ncbi:zinc-binding alcohol dehydrogenase [Ruficoccus amylovorans]|uniref:Zinc-binding alcohol dehydrogenase n=1 Tax=Ruficoccus amylovorans TaxID=1804625 RepID=A0A842HIP5_9BACT|nr:zinc-binding alcohol dehydrogenase [Ruficoccus amylovorans]MBC2595858.1 zinc-binding alcohol dehydrogenase [Ruficoccus amylovorans]